MKNDGRFERLAFASALLVLAAIIMLVCLDLPTDKTVYMSGLIETIEITTEDKTNVEYPININTATVEELQNVSGIGYDRAYHIVAYREKLGGYTSLEQLMDISGIGEKTFAKISPYLTI